MTDSPATPPPAAPVGTLLPPETVIACEAAGVAKVRRGTMALFVLGLLAGAFISFGALFMTVVTTGAGEMPWGVTRLLGGTVFSLGLILVIAVAFDRWLKSRVRR